MAQLTLKQASIIVDKAIEKAREMKFAALAAELQKRGFDMPGIRD